VGNRSRSAATLAARRRRRPPAPTWRTCLTNHAPTLVSIDFFPAATLAGRIVLAVIELLHQR